MKTVTSKDGTTIAYDELGSGPPLVLVDGAFCRRKFGPMGPLAKALSDRYTVFHYDRRGRDDSGDTQPYAVDRELEDLAAVVEKAGGEPFMYGTSSGAALALRAVGSGAVRVKKLFVYEPAFMLRPEDVPAPADFRDRIDTMLKDGDRDGVVKLFLKVVGVPSFAIFFMRLLPNVWPKIRMVAHTLPYDFAVLGDTQSGKGLPADLERMFATIDVPTTVGVGSKSPAWMQYSVERTTKAVPHAAHRVVQGQDHNASAKAMAPVLAEAFSS